MVSNEYFDDDEFREMLDEYERTVQSGQMVFMDADDLADIADYYQLNGRYEEADRAIERAIELQPNSPLALSYKVREAVSRKDYQAAADYLAKITDDCDPEYIYCCAEIWIAQGMVEDAERFLSYHLNHTVPQDEYQDYVYDVVNLWSDYNYGEKAMEWMMRLPPNETEEFKELMGRTYFGVGAYDDSERIFNELIDKNPFQKRYWNALANAQYMKGDYSASVSSSEYAMAIDPEDTESMLARANALFRLENYEEALRYYERYSEKKQGEESALYCQGCCLVNMGRYEDAKKRLLKAETMAPADSSYLAEIYQELAYIYGEQKMPDQALEYLEKTASLDCDHADMLVVRGHILLGNGRVEEAMAAYDAALLEAAFSPKIQLRIIVSIYDNHYVEMAYKMFQKYFADEGERPAEGYAYMALCCYDLYLVDEYLHYLQEACQRNPTEAKAVLGYKFPPDLKPEEYYEFAKKQMKK